MNLKLFNVTTILILSLVFVIVHSIKLRQHNNDNIGDIVAKKSHGWKKLNENAKASTLNLLQVHRAEAKKGGKGGKARRAEQQAKKKKQEETTKATKRAEEDTKIRQQKQEQRAKRIQMQKKQAEVNAKYKKEMEVKNQPEQRQKRWERSFEKDIGQNR